MRMQHTVSSGQSGEQVGSQSAPTETPPLGYLSACDQCGRLDFSGVPVGRLFTPARWLSRSRADARPGAGLRPSVVWRTRTLPMMIQGTFAVWKLCWPEIPAISATRQPLPAISRHARLRAIIRSVFGLAARQAEAACGADGWFRAGERKTDWTEPRAARLSYGFWMRSVSVPGARRVGPGTPRGPLLWPDGAWTGSERWAG